MIARHLSERILQKKLEIFAVQLIPDSVHIIRRVEAVEEGIVTNLLRYRAHVASSARIQRVEQHVQRGTGDSDRCLNKINGNGGDVAIDIPRQS